MKPTFLAGLIAAGLLSACGSKQDSPPLVTATPATNTSSPVAVAPTPSARFGKLPGKWLRPDGGYVLEIRSVAPDGKLDASYANPRPINVSRAEATQDGGATKVFVELRDVNYPGSTYTLVYQPENDQLAGIYYQAALQQQFDVFFERTK
jgi:hypothetical protein